VRIIESDELEHLVRETFPARRVFSAASELGLQAGRAAISFVHGGPDPFLDRGFDAWLGGASKYIALYPLLNRLCRAGAIAPGNYAVTVRQ
jgi:hypothetical protein